MYDPYGLYRSLTVTSGFPRSFLPNKNDLCDIRIFFLRLLFFSSLHTCLIYKILQHSRKSTDLYIYHVTQVCLSVRGKKHPLKYVRSSNMTPWNGHWKSGIFLNFNKTKSNVISLTSHKLCQRVWCYHMMRPCTKKVHLSQMETATHWW